MVAVIGDVHGCYYTLEALYKKVKEKYPGIPVYCVGDLVDRGKYSCQTVDFFIEKDIKFTVGNHDLMFYYYYKEPDSPFAQVWTYNGSDNTLASYKGNEYKIEEHLSLIERAPLCFNLADCFISHAGISNKYKNILPANFSENLAPLLMLIQADRKAESGILWNRGKLLNINKLQILGHTKQPEIKHDEDSAALYIDTGAVAGNKLSAVILENNKWIDTLEEPAQGKDIG